MRAGLRVDVQAGFDARCTDGTYVRDQVDVRTKQENPLLFSCAPTKRDSHRKRTGCTGVTSASQSQLDDTRGYFYYGHESSKISRYAYSHTYAQHWDGPLQRR